MDSKKDDDATSTATMSSSGGEGAVRGGALASNSDMSRRGSGRTTRYTDELNDHWQKQFTEKAADPSAAGYTGHSSGFRDQNVDLPPPPIDAAPPTTGAFESQLPKHTQAAIQPPAPTLVAPPAAVQGEGGVNAPALFTPAPVSSMSAGSPSGGSSVSRYPEAGGMNSSGSFSYEPAAPSWEPPAGQSGFGGQQDVFGSGAPDPHDGGTDPRWEADGGSEGAPTGPPIEVVKKEIIMFLNATKAKVQVDQNAQIMAVGACLLTLGMLFVLGIWLLVFAVLAVCGAVGYRVHVLTKQPQRAAPGAFDKDF